MDLTNEKPVALIITVIEGQDGAYLAEFLLEKGYDCHAIICFLEPSNPTKPSDENCSYLHNIYLQNEKLRVHAQDVRDTLGLANLFMFLKPAEIYYLTSKDSFDNTLPDYLGTSTNCSPAELDEIRGQNIVNAIQMCGLEKSVKLFLELTTDVMKLRNARTPFQLRSPHYSAMLNGLGMTVNCRRALKLFVCNGLLAGHESPRQSHNLPSRKITSTVAKRFFGFNLVLMLGDLDSMRDWGHARDYARAMWLTLQQQEPDDYAIATGVWETVRKFVEVAFEFVGMHVQWIGEGINEVGNDSKTGELLVGINPSLYSREKNFPSAKALVKEVAETKQKLNWQPDVTFKMLVTEMMQTDLRLLKEELNAAELKQ